MKNKQIFLLSELPGLTISTESHNAFGRFKPVFKNETSTDIRIKELELASFSDEFPKGINALRFGFNMPGDPAGFIGMDEDGFTSAIKMSDRFYLKEEGEICSISSNSLLCFKAEDSDEITLIGTESFNKSEGTIELVYNKTEKRAKIIYKMILDNIELAPNDELELDSFIIMTGNDLNTLLKDWAELTAAANGSLIPEKIPTGWNDWQYYRNEKTAKDVLDSAEVIAELKSQGYPLDFAQVDGGFCVHLSEWSMAKPAFAPGIKDLAEKIIGMGLKFGLWFAPYIQNVNTSVVKEHPEWVLKDENGDPLILGQSNVGESCLIDYTVPGTEEWLREQLRFFIDDWQVTWIKLDGPNHVPYRCGQLHDRSKTISQMLKRTFEIIKEEAGADVLVEGEGAMGAALGKVGLHRVQTDNHPKWHDANNIDNEYAPRVYGKELIMGFLHNRWWCNHRENVVLRNYPSEFSHAGLHDQNAVEQMFTEPEFRTQLSAAVMGSGGLLLTDPMKELVKDQERFAWISKILPVYDRAAEMLDVFPKGRYPSIYKTEVDENFLIYSFTNWTNKTCDFECKLQKNTEYHAFSVFDQNVIGLVKDTLQISGVSAHDSRIIVLKKLEKIPQLLATDMHLLPGTVDIKSSIYNDDVLEIDVCHFKQDDNNLILAANGHKIIDIKTNALRFSIDDFNTDYPMIHFQGNPGETIFQIKWRMSHP